MPKLLRAYPLALGAATPELLAVALVVLPATQAALAASWTEAAFDLLLHAGQDRALAARAKRAAALGVAPETLPLKAFRSRAYTVAGTTGLLPVPAALPSRVGRAVREVAGRTLRSQAQRRTLYELLRDEKGLPACRLADRDTYVTGPVLVARNVAEAMGNWLRANPDEPLPEVYTEFQAVPELQTAVMTAAADDGSASAQFIRRGLSGAACDELWFEIKTPGQDGHWRWSARHTLVLPEIVRVRLAGNWRLAAPDVRVKPDGSAFFDLKLKTVSPRLKEHPRRRVLGVDWGVKHLVVLQAVEGNVRLGVPLYLHEGGLLAKLDNIRTHAHRAQADNRQALNLALVADACGQPQVRDGLLRLALYRLREKQALWAKFTRIQQTLALNAALAIMRRAQHLECDTIAVEALGGLRSQDKGPRINWRVNAQVRAFTHKRVKDLADEYGLHVKLVSAHQTSLSCPACRALGVRTRSPEHRQPVAGGTWFRCLACGCNGSADYIAATNIALLGAHARKGQRVAAMPVVQRTLTSQRRILVSRLQRLLRQAHATTPGSYRGAGPMLPFPLGRVSASKHHGYPRRIRLSQQRHLSSLLAAA